MFCGISWADVIYTSNNWKGNGNSNFDDFQETVKRIRVDGSGNISEISSKIRGEEYGDDKYYRFHVVSVDGRERLITFNPVEVETAPGVFTTEDKTQIRVYSLDDLSKPRASQIFPDTSMPNVDDGQPTAWGSNVLLPCKDNTIVELNPETCSIVQSYTYPEQNDLAHGVGFSTLVQIWREKIYAVFRVHPFNQNAVHTSSLRGADTAGDPFNDFVEMSQLGRITDDLTQLNPITNYKGSESEIQQVDGRNAIRYFTEMYSIDGKLYIIYYTHFTDVIGEQELGIYCFSDSVNLETASKIIYPDNLYITGMCSDGHGGIYISAYEFSSSTGGQGGYETMGYMMEDLTDSAVFHYDGTALTKVFTMSPGASQWTLDTIAYDKQNGILILSEGSANDYTKKLLFLSPDASGNLHEVNSIEKVLWFSIAESSSSYNSDENTPSPDNTNNAPTTDNTPTVNDNNQSNDIPANDTPPADNNQPYPPYDDPYGYDDGYDRRPDYGEGAGESKGSGGCSSGFWMICLAASASIAMSKKGR